MLLEKVIPKVKDEQYLKFVVFLEKFCFIETDSISNAMVFTPWFDACRIFCLYIIIIIIIIIIIVLVKSVCRQYSSMI